MKKLQTVSFAVITIFILVSCSLFTPKDSQNDEKPGNVNLSVADLPVLDLEGPLPSPGAASLKALAVDEPGVAALVDDVEASERAALQAAIEELQAQLPPTGFTQDFASAGGSLSENFERTFARQSRVSLPNQRCSRWFTTPRQPFARLKAVSAQHP